MELYQVHNSPYDRFILEVMATNTQEAAEKAAEDLDDRGMPLSERTLYVKNDDGFTKYRVIRKATITYNYVSKRV